MIEIPKHLLANKRPFFVCSRRILKTQIESLKDLGLDIYYSTKTNPEKGILDALRGENVGFSVSSKQEYLRVLSAGAGPEDIIYYDRAPTKGKIAWLIDRGCVNFTVDSTAAFENLMPFVREGMCVFLRTRTCEAGNPYSGFDAGMPFRELDKLFGAIKKSGAKTGILHHSSSQLENPADWMKKFEELQRAPEVDIINIGGGIPIDYGGGKGSDRILEVISKGVSGLDGVRVIAEPGRYIVGPACSLVGRVELVSGYDAVLNCSVYDTHIDTIIANIILPARTIENKGKKHEYRLLGSSLCSLDVFNEHAKLEELREGDFVVLDNAGAYNFSSEFCTGSGIETHIID